MLKKRVTARTKSAIAVILFIVLSFTNHLHAQDGKALFQANCASCHAVNKQLTGPALAGVEDRWASDPKMLRSWIRNNKAVIKSGYPYAVNLYSQYKIPMNIFSNFSDKDIDAILTYIKSVPPDGGGGGSGTPVVDAAAEAQSIHDKNLIFGIITLVLAIVAFTLLQVNGNLRKLAADKDGVPALEPIPAWRNKTYIMMGTLVLFTIGGYYTVQGAIGLGRSQNYEPEQPIYYSHEVHAGVNQINCQYCHIGVYQGKQATLPSVNICMNCHMAINEYNGKTKLTRADGKEVNGTAEIQKLYKYAGFTKGQPWDAANAKPIPWTRIHNLPDHVYFNHQQHVVAGKQACQNCHGEITKMGEVYQFAPLSMGWCINCHRNTAVNFKGNGFYSIYEKYHDDIKAGKMDSVTVEAIGGTECQKCHY